jgi:hypothetical protein
VLNPDRQENPMSQNARHSTPSVGERVELGRYRVTAGERILFGQRIDGVVRVTDRPSGPGGRSYLVDCGLERDGYSALKALVADYTREARRLDGIPMATSLARRTIEQEEA